MLNVGDLLHGRYHIERVLARGGMGIVYRARHAVLADRAVAVKEMAVAESDPETHRQAVEQFQQEARILSSLEHPGLVRVIDYFEDDGAHYLVMELVEGRTLEELMLERRQPIAEVLDWVDQICDALAWLHAQAPPIVYRDLKPGNVMLDARGRIRLLDFGIARACAVGSQTGTFIRGAGTPGYAPVEQFGGGNTDARADIYALGATLYSLLTGEVPPFSIDIMCGDRALPDPSTRADGIPVELDACVRRLMAVHRDDRPPTVGQAQVELRAVARSVGWRSTKGLKLRRVVPPGPRRTAAAAPVVSTSPVTVRFEDAHPEAPPRESKWVAHLHDLSPEPVRVRPRRSSPDAYVWLAQLAITLVLVAVALPYYFPAFRLGVLAFLNLPALLTGHMLSLMLDHSGMVAVLATLAHLGLPMCMMQYFSHRRRRFASMVCLSWLSVNILELAVCLRYAHTLKLPFAVDFAHCWTSVLAPFGLTAQSAAVLGALRLAGLLGLFTALTTMLWRTLGRSMRRA